MTVEAYSESIIYAGQSGGQLNLGPFKGKLGALADARIQAYAESVPPEWRGKSELCERVVEYLVEARAQREKLVSFVGHLLR